LGVIVEVSAVGFPVSGSLIEIVAGSGSEIV